MNKKEYIKELENIKNENSITIDNLEILLVEMKEKNNKIGFSEYINILKKAKVGEQIKEREQLKREGKLHPSDDCHTND